MWNQLAHQILVTESLKQNDYDPCVYYDDLDGDRWIIVLIFVDDLLVIGSSMRSDEFISNITKKLCISSNSELKRYISVDVDTHPEGGFFLSQTSDILKCVVKHGLSEAKPVVTPFSENGHCSLNSCFELHNKHLLFSSVNFMISIVCFSFPSSCH